MQDRAEELKGNIKSGLGKAIDNEQMEAEGKTEATSARTERHVKGGAREASGKLKEGVGRLTGDDATTAEGKADQLRGKADRKD